MSVIIAFNDLQVSEVVGLLSPIDKSIVIYVRPPKKRNLILEMHITANTLLFGDKSVRAGSIVSGNGVTVGHSKERPYFTKRKTPAIVESMFLNQIVVVNKK